MATNASRFLRDSIARHVRDIPRSGIRDFFEIVSTKKDVISLGIGEPDFDTPEQPFVLLPIVTKVAGGEGEGQELNVALVGERLAQDASGWDGRLCGQIGEEGVGRGHVSTRCGLPERDYLRRATAARRSQSEAPKAEGRAFRSADRRPRRRICTVRKADTRLRRDGRPDLSRGRDCWR